MTHPVSRFIAPPLLAATLLAAPVQAQESEDGFSLMDEGMRLILRGLMQELDPALEELDALTRDLAPMMQDFLVEMGPALRGLMEQVEDWSAYHPPEILPNGDIIIRRKTPAELAEDAEKDAVDL